MTGILGISNGESRINGALLARDDGDDPFGSATEFLHDNGCRDGDCVTVTGTQRSDAFHIDSAVRVASSVCRGAPAMALELAGIRRTPAGKKAAERKKAKPVKKSAKPGATGKGARKNRAKNTGKRKRGR